MPYEDRWEDIVQIVLSEKNSQHFENVLDRAKNKYRKEVVKRESEMVEVLNWNVPPALPFGGEYKKVEVKKSVMEPFFSGEGWKSEVAFINFLERAESVEWWFKNGDQNSTFFAVPYENGDLPGGEVGKKPFYIDFIVKLKDGRVGLFDPHGLFLSDFKAKNDGLYQYVQQEKKKGKRLFGGIVANTGEDYQGRWVYFDKPSSKLKQDFGNWVDLIL